MPSGGDAVSTLQQILNSLGMKLTRAIRCDCANAHVVPDGLPRFRAFLPQDLDTHRAHRLHGSFKSQLTRRPRVANFRAGKTSGSDKPYQVIEAVPPNTRQSRDSIAPVPVDGAGGLLIDWGRPTVRQRKINGVITRPYIPGVAVAVCVEAAVVAFGGIKSGRTAVILNRR